MLSALAKFIGGQRGRVVKLDDEWLSNENQKLCYLLLYFYNFLLSPSLFKFSLARNGRARDFMTAALSLSLLGSLLLF